MQPTQSAALLGSWRLRQLHIVAAGVYLLLAGFE
jgi:hypothetical protein